MPSPATILWPETFAARVQAAAEQLGAQQLVQRLWDRDAALWSAEPAVQEAIRQRLGWLSIVDTMEGQVESIQALAQEVRQEGFTHAFLLGMGGSSLFAEVCRGIFGVAPGWLELTVLDTTDQTAITAAGQRAPSERTVFIVSSKSGTTIESHSLGDYFYERIRTVRGDRAGQQFLAITDAGTPLAAEANQRAFRRVFTHGPATGAEVGGRFSALTGFGLIPAALMGVDVRQLLSRAKAMLAAAHPSTPITDNPAAQLAIALTEAAAQGKDKVTLVAAEPLRSFGVWAEQLIAESTGKSGTGLIPIDGEPPRDPDSYAADRVFVEWQLSAQLDVRLERHLEAVARRGHPVIRLRWSDRYDVGGEAIRWFMATALAAGVMRINPFDEPNVKESKDRTLALLDRFIKDGKLPSREPVLVDSGVSVYAAAASVSGRSVTDVVRAFLRQVRPGDYVAVLSFLPRTSANDQAVESLRNRIAEVLGVAAMVGYGPRYLHSSGQLHKGGPDRVVLLVLTAEESEDLPIPNTSYSFRILKQAQALGEVEALTERNRRILHLHLAESPDTVLSGLERALDRSLKVPAAVPTRSFDAAPNLRPAGPCSGSS